jgi:hypothetical protein
MQAAIDAAAFQPQMPDRGFERASHTARLKQPLKIDTA